MPIYEYVCPACGHDFERIVRVGAPPPPCPACSHAEVDKKVSLAAFQLKGAGWYKDAYAGRDNQKPAADKPSSDAGPAADAKPSSEPKPSPDAKPAAATPAAPAPAAPAKAAGT